MTEVAICNRALTALGSQPIASLDDQSTEGILCNQWYSHCRDALQGTGHFDFVNLNYLLERSEASSFDGASVMQNVLWTSNVVGGSFITTGGAQWGYEYAFVLPTDCLRVNFLHSSNTTSHDVLYEDWQVDGNILQTNLVPVYANLAIRQPDTDKFPVLFTDALQTLLAAEMCMPLTKDKHRWNMLMSAYTSKVTGAKGNDRAVKAQRFKPRRSDVNRARWGYGRYTR